MKLPALVVAFLLHVLSICEAKPGGIRHVQPQSENIRPEHRLLQTLAFRGSDPSFILNQCEGDCDSDSDCAGNLICFEKDLGDSSVVPGCQGQDSTRNDYCIDPADLNPPPTTPPPTAPPQALTSPPQTTSPTAPPPSPTAPPPTPTLAPVSPTTPPVSPPTDMGMALFSYGADPPSDAFPLGVCEGDCDVDADCAGSMVCWQRGMNDGPVPGCNGSDSSRTDYCIMPIGSPTAPPPTPSPIPSPVASPVSNPTSAIQQNFKLKLYWEQGYFWQEETFERKWCMRCRQGFCDFGDKLYIEECDDSGVQRFDFQSLNADEVLIILHGTNKCLERQNRDIFIRVCDQGEQLQRWFAKVGEFDEFRFEISQFTASNLCITQRHHPKPDEEVELEPCTQARNGETSFWERCYTNSC